MKPGHRKPVLIRRLHFFSLKRLLIDGVVFFQCYDLALLLLTCTRSISVHAHAFFGSSFHSLNFSSISK